MFAAVDSFPNMEILDDFSEPQSRELSPAVLNGNNNGLGDVELESEGDNNSREDNISILNMNSVQFTKQLLEDDKSYALLKETVVQLKDRLKRRNLIIDEIRKSYLRDVISIKNITLNVLHDSEREQVVQQHLVQLPSLDLRNGVSLFAPAKSELNIKLCEECGGHLEIVSRDTDEVETLKRKVSEVKEREGRFRIKLATLDAQLEEMGREKAESSKSHFEEKRYLYGEIKRLKDEVVTVRDEVARMKVANKRVREENESFKTRNAALFQAMDKLEKVEGELERMNDNWSESVETMHEMRSTEKVYKKEIQQYKATVNDNQDTIRKLNQQLSLAKAELTQGEQVQKKLSDDLENLQRNLDRAQAENLEYCIQVAELRDKLRIDSEGYEKESQKLDRRMVKMKRILSEGQKKYRDLKHDCRTLSKAVMKRDEAMKRLREDSWRLRGQVEDCTEEIVLYEEEVRILQKFIHDSIATILHTPPARRLSLLTQPNPSSPNPSTTTGGILPDMMHALTAVYTTSAAKESQQKAAHEVLITQLAELNALSSQIPTMIHSHAEYVKERLARRGEAAHSATGPQEDVSDSDREEDLDLDHSDEDEDEEGPDGLDAQKERGGVAGEKGDHGMGSAEKKGKRRGGNYDSLNSSNHKNRRSPSRGRGTTPTHPSHSSRPGSSPLATTPGAAFQDRISSLLAKGEPTHNKEKLTALKAKKAARRAKLMSTLRKSQTHLMMDPFEGNEDPSQLGGTVEQEVGEGIRSEEMSVSQVAAIFTETTSTSPSNIHRGAPRGIIKDPDLADEEDSFLLGADSVSQEYFDLSDDNTASLDEGSRPVQDEPRQRMLKPSSSASESHGRSHHSHLKIIVGGKEGDSKPKLVRTNSTPKNYHFYSPVNGINPSYSGSMDNMDQLLDPSEQHRMMRTGNRNRRKGVDEGGKTSLDASVYRDQRSVEVRHGKVPSEGDVDWDFNPPHADGWRNKTTPTVRHKVPEIPVVPEHHMPVSRRAHASIRVVDPAVDPPKEDVNPVDPVGDTRTESIILDNASEVTMSVESVSIVNAGVETSPVLPEETKPVVSVYVLPKKAAPTPRKPGGGQSTIPVIDLLPPPDGASRIELFLRDAIRHSVDGLGRNMANKAMNLASPVIHKHCQVLVSLLESLWGALLNNRQSLDFYCKMELVFQQMLASSADPTVTTADSWNIVGSQLIPLAASTLGSHLTLAWKENCDLDNELVLGLLPLYDEATDEWKPIRYFDFYENVDETTFLNRVKTSLDAVLKMTQFGQDTLHRVTDDLVDVLKDWMHSKTACIDAEGRIEEERQRITTLWSDKLQLVEAEAANLVLMVNRLKESNGLLEAKVEDLSVYPIRLQEALLQIEQNAFEAKVNREMISDLRAKVVEAANKIDLRTSEINLLNLKLVKKNETMAGLEQELSAKEQTLTDLQDKMEEVTQDKMHLQNELTKSIEKEEVRKSRWVEAGVQVEASTACAAVQTEFLVPPMNLRTIVANRQSKQGLNRYPAVLSQSMDALSVYGTNFNPSLSHSAASGGSAVSLPTGSITMKSQTGNPLAIGLPPMVSSGTFLMSTGQTRTRAEGIKTTHYFSEDAGDGPTNQDLLIDHEDRMLRSSNHTREYFYPRSRHPVPASWDESSPSAHDREPSAGGLGPDEADPPQYGMNAIQARIPSAIDYQDDGYSVGSGPSIQSDFSFGRNHRMMHHTEEDRDGGGDRGWMDLIQTKDGSPSRPASQYEQIASNLGSEFGIPMTPAVGGGSMRGSIGSITVEGVDPDHKNRSATMATRVMNQHQVVRNGIVYNNKNKSEFRINPLDHPKNPLDHPKRVPSSSELDVMVTNGYQRNQDMEPSSNTLHVNYPNMFFEKSSPLHPVQAVSQYHHPSPGGGRGILSNAANASLKTSGQNVIGATASSRWPSAENGIHTNIRNLSKPNPSLLPKPNPPLTSTIPSLQQPTSPSPPTTTSDKEIIRNMKRELLTRY